VKGDITAGDLADVASARHRDPPRGGFAKPAASGGGDVEEIEPPSLAHITVRRPERSSLGRQLLNKLLNSKKCTGGAAGADAMPLGAAGTAPSAVRGLSGVVRTWSGKRRQCSAAQNAAWQALCEPPSGWFAGT